MRGVLNLMRGVLNSMRGVLDFDEACPSTPCGLLPAWGSVAKATKPLSHWWDSFYFFDTSLNERRIGFDEELIGVDEGRGRPCWGLGEQWGNHCQSH